MLAGIDAVRINRDELTSVDFSIVIVDEAHRSVSSAFRVPMVVKNMLVSQVEEPEVADDEGIPRLRHQGSNRSDRHGSACMSSHLTSVK